MTILGFCKGFCKVIHEILIFPSYTMLILSCGDAHRHAVYNRCLSDKCAWALTFCTFCRVKPTHSWFKIILQTRFCLFTHQCTPHTTLGRHPDDEYLFMRNRESDGHASCECLFSTTQSTTPIVDRCLLETTRVVRHSQSKCENYREYYALCGNFGVRVVGFMAK